MQNLFKQKTAYEIVCGDWSSDVCSSDLVVLTIIPNTGASLPFISYGGSAVLFTLAEMGIVLSVNRYHMRRSLQRKRAELEKEEEQ